MVRLFYAEAINARDPGACHRLLGPRFRHNGVERGRDGQAEAVAAFLAGFSDLRDEILILLAEGNFVTAHQRWSGTHDGPFMGFAPTGKNVRFASTAILRVEDGLIREAWDVIDLSLLTQLQAQQGATP